MASNLFSAVEKESIWANLQDSGGHGRGLLPNIPKFIKKNTL
jgi:hypothetical protein